jgi:hypothetical protein
MTHYPNSTREVTPNSWCLDLLWSCGSGIYNYLCNQCLSPLTLGVWILVMAGCTRHNIMW